MIHRGLTAVIAVIAVIVFGCVGSTVVGPSATHGAPVSSAPAAQATTTAPTTAPTATPTAVVAVSSASPEGSGGPPEATLSVEGGDPVTGQLGTYTWADGGSDSPWLPGTPLKAATGERLTMALGGGVALGSWTARRIHSGSEGGAGATSIGTGSGGPVTFTAPPKGAWSVQVAVEFGGDQGSASYYWRLDVR